MAVPDKDFQYIKDRLAKYVKEELAIDDNAFTVQHTFKHQNGVHKVESWPQ